jgi:hypothetical protein
MDTNSTASQVDVFTALAYLELPSATQSALTALAREQGLGVVTGFMAFQGDPGQDAGWNWKLNTLPINQRQALERLKVERERVRDEANEEARANWLAKVEAKKDEAQAEAKAARAEQLATIRANRRRAWLIDHPGNTDADFEAIWPHIYEQLKSDESERYIEQRVAELRASGRSF